MYGIQFCAAVTDFCGQTDARVELGHLSCSFCGLVQNTFSCLNFFKTWCPLTFQSDKSVRSQARILLWNCLGPEMCGTRDLSWKVRANQRRCIFVRWLLWGELCTVPYCSRRAEREPVSGLNLVQKTISIRAPAVWTHRETGLGGPPLKEKNMLRLTQRPWCLL